MMQTSGQYIHYTDEEQKEIFGPAVKETGFSFPVSVSLTMPAEQAQRLGRGSMVCILPDLPDSGEVYYRLSDLPVELVTFGGDSWQRIVDVPRESIAAVMKMLYPDGLHERYWRIISAIEGDTIRLTGFGD